MMFKKFNEKPVFETCISIDSVVAQFETFVFYLLVSSLRINPLHPKPPLKW